MLFGAKKERFFGTRRPKRLASRLHAVVASVSARQEEARGRGASPSRASGNVMIDAQTKANSPWSAKLATRTEAIASRVEPCRGPRRALRLWGLPRTRDYLSGFSPWRGMLRSPATKDAFALAANGRVENDAGSSYHRFLTGHVQPDSL